MTARDGKRHPGSAPIRQSGLMTDERSEGFNTLVIESKLAIAESGSSSDASPFQVLVSRAERRSGAGRVYLSDCPLDRPEPPLRQELPTGKTRLAGCRSPFGGSSPARGPVLRGRRP